MKFFQLTQTIGRVLLLAVGTGAAALGALQAAPRKCAGPARKLPANGLVSVVAPAVPKAGSGRVVRVVDADTYDVLAGGCGIGCDCWAARAGGSLRGGPAALDGGPGDDGAGAAVREPEAPVGRGPG